MDEQLESADTLQDQEQPNDSSGVLSALDEARSSFQPWSDQCKRIDDTWNAAKRMAAGAVYDDDEFDLFWASTQILKPAIYARPPVPVVTTRFSIRDPFTDHVSEMLERVLTTTLTQTGIDDVMRGLRDDLILSSRGMCPGSRSMMRTESASSWSIWTVTTSCISRHANGRKLAGWRVLRG